MAFQGDAFQPNAFQAGPRDLLVGAVQVLEVYQYRPPTTSVSIAQVVEPIQAFIPRALEARAATVQPPVSTARTFQIAEPPVEAFNPRAYLPAARTVIELRGTAQVFKGNEPRQSDLLGAVQVIENYGQKLPQTVVQTLQVLQDLAAAAPPVQTFPAWLPRTAQSTQPLASSVGIAQASQRVETFYPRSWEARATSTQPAASTARTFQIVEPAVETFYPTARQISVQSALERRGSSFTVTASPPIETFNPIARQTATRTSVELRGSTWLFNPYELAPVAVTPSTLQGWIVRARSDVDLKTSARTFLIGEEPPFVPPPIPVEVPEFDGGYRHHAPPDREPERQRERRRKQEELRKTVERAYRIAFGEPLEDKIAERPLPPEPVRKRQLRRVAVMLLPEIRVLGIRTTLADIMRLLEEYQAELLLQWRRAKDEEEAILVLLLAA